MFISRIFQSTACNFASHNKNFEWIWKKRSSGATRFVFHVPTISPHQIEIQLNSYRILMTLLKIHNNEKEKRFQKMNQRHGVGTDLFTGI